MRIMGAAITVVLFVYAGTARAEHPLMADYHRAWELTHQLRTQEAIPLLDSVIARDKTFHLAYKTLALAFYYARDFKGGERHFQKLIKDDAGSGLAHYGLALVLDHFNDARGARREMEACIERSFPKRYVYVCYSTFELQSHSADLQSPVRRPGDDPYFKLQLAESLNNQRDYEALRRVAPEGLERARAMRHRELEGAYLRVMASYSDRDRRLDLATQSQKIWQEAGDREEELSLAPFITACLRRMGRVTNAEEELERYQRIAENWGSHKYMGGLLRQRGDLCEERGDLDGVLRFNSQAKAELERYPPTETYFETFHHMGDAYQRLGRIPEAAQEFEGLRQAARRADSRIFEAYGLRYLADLHAELGDYFKALDYNFQSFKIFEEFGRVSGSARDTSGASLTRIGKIYAALGDYSNAESYFRRGLKIAIETQDWDPQQRVHIELATLYLQTDRPERALEELASARKAAALTHNLVFEPSTLRNSGRAYRQLKRLPEALQSLRESLRVAEQIGVKSEQAETLIELGTTHLQARNIPSAEECFSRSLTLAESLDSLRLIVPARLGLADLEEARRSKDRSLEHLLHAIQALEDIRNRLPGSTFRAGLQSQFRMAYERSGDLLAQSGNARESFRLAEQGRARGFLDLLAEGHAQITKGLPPRERERQAVLTSAVSRTSAAVLKDGSESNRRAVAAAENELQKWVADGYRSHPQYSELQYPQAFDLDQAQATTPDDETALIEFVVGDKQSRVWVVRRGEFSMVYLPRRDVLDAAVKALRQSISLPPKNTHAFDAYQAQSESLYRMLLGPVEGRLRGVRRLLIVPDGILHYLPFETLRQRDGRYLIEDFTVVYAPSVSIYGHLADTWKQKARPNTRAELVAFGDPAYGSGSSTMRSVLERGGVSLGRLPYTREEVSKIASLFQTPQRKTYLGAEATEEALKHETLSRFRRIHIAAHAVVDERLPIRSGILLAPGSGREDGLLTMAEIFNLELDADLVVLSACQTGLGQLVRGEGMVGLTRAILYAGSPRVAVSLWEVNDLATAQFMEAFYKGLSAGEAPAAALRAAKLSFLRGAAQGLRHPYFWAPFVMTGLF